MATNVVPAGSNLAVFRPYIFYAPVGSPVPPITTPYGLETWPSPWKPIRDTVGGISPTPQNPQDTIQGDRQGVVGRMPTGEATVAIAMQALYADIDLVMALSPFVKTSVAAVTGPPAYPAYDVYNFKADVPKQIMLGWDGFSKAGTFTDVDSIVRTIAFHCQLTDDLAWVFRHSGGGDAPFEPEFALEAVPGPLSASQFTDTGIDMSIVDPDGRYTQFIIPVGS
ncbi:hypothetical protein [Rubrobacter calidifluminis]|uniref:hypothetical protein n=1 Tax=Rubrobacter calidifluminis TaxID=1392640 RepID=UPI002360C913|nr:hypothetical protein [Rubrobacter calidifluminis]